MKWLLVLLVLGGAGVAFWMFQDELFNIVDGDDDKKEQAEGGPSTPAKEPTPRDRTPVTPPVTPRSRVPEAADPFAQQYPMPEFRPLAELVGNWNDVPGSAFPRTITLKKAAKYVIAGGAGSSTAPAGSKTVALAIAGGQLLIAPRQGATVRGQIAVDDTNFKEDLATSYEAYKVRQRKKVLAQRDRARKLAATEPQEPSTPPPPPATSGQPTYARDVRPSAEKLAEYESQLGPMPKRGSDGRIQIMVQSIQRKDVTEFGLANIEHWGKIRYELVDGEPYWTGSVRYKSTSLFGTFDTEAMALIRDNRVREWVYTGSLQQVP